MRIVEEKNNIKVYNDGVLIIEETGYNNIALIISKLKNVIQDEYQLKILNQILKEINLSEVA